jgi:hypothetical protein
MLEAYLLFSAIATMEGKVPELERLGWQGSHGLIEGHYQLLPEL